jgi:hypothetical protein
MASISSDAGQLATAPPPRQTTWSLPSITALACGIFLIVPYISGLCAIALAVIGLRQTAGGEYYGRRLAWGAIVLGLLNIVGWTIFFWIIADLSAPGRATAHRFFFDLNSAAEQARQDCLGVAADRLDSAAAQIQSWGGVKSVTVLYVTTDSNNGTITASIRGDLGTGSGKHFFQLHTTESKVTDFSIQ